MIDNRGIVVYTQLLKEDLMIIRFIPECGEPIPDYKAGQFITLGLPNPTEGGKIVRRAYSIASHPENKKYFELVIRQVRKPLPGRLSTQIFNLKEGDEILWLKPTGKALLINQELSDGKSDTRRIVCVGGGIGIVPFISFVRHLHAIRDKREIVLLHGVSYVDEMIYKDLLINLENESNVRGKKEWNFTYRSTISRPTEWFNRSWSGQRGRVETFLKPQNNGISPLEELIGENITKENTIFYVCGWQGTIDSVVDLLKTKGFVTEYEKREDGGFEIKYESYG